jgi:hypothetical protein
MLIYMIQVLMIILDKTISSKNIRPTYDALVYIKYIQNVYKFNTTI